MTFWIAAALIAIATGALLALAILRGRGNPRLAAANDVEVYRDQLSEIDRDLKRGVLDPAEAERTRLEVSRRLLDADRKARGSAPAASAPRPAAMAVAAGVLLLVVGGSFALYARLGAPGYGDLPLAARIEAAEQARASRPSQETAEAQAAPRRPDDVPQEYLDLIERLRATVEARPDDVQGLELLARNEARLGNFAAAHEAQRRLIELRGDAASAADWAGYADLLVLAAGGYVSPQAEEAVGEIFARDPDNGRARYYEGLLHAQTGRPDLAFRIWRPLLEESGPDDPWTAPIRAQIESVARQAGRDYTAPDRAPAPGPSAQDLAAAADMDPESREAMAREMVGRLSQRLAEEGGGPAEWARLIAALGVLGETEQAQEIYREARQVFGDAPDALAPIEDAAAQAGLSR